MQIATPTSTLPLMEITAFDTHDFVKRLTEVGMPEAQAEILAEEQSRLIKERLATKQDLKAMEVAIMELKRDIKELEDRLKRDMMELKRDLRELEDRLKRDMMGLKRDLKEAEGGLKRDLKEAEGGLNATSGKPKIASDATSRKWSKN